METSIKKKHLNLKKLRLLSWSLVRGILVIGLSVIILQPMFVRLVSALMTEEQIYDLTVRWIPREVTLENFRIAFYYMRYISSFFNTMTLTLSVSGLQLLSSILVGYGFARFEFKGREVLFILVILTLLVPPQVIMIPLFLNFRFFNIFGLLPNGGIDLLESYWPFILTALTGTAYRSGLLIYVARQYFKGMSKNLEEASYVDGAGSLKTFFMIMLPGAFPIILVIFIFSFVWQYNDTFFLNLYLRQGGDFLAFRLTTAVSDYVNSYARGYLEISREQRSIINNAGMMLFLLPLLIFYAFLQRYFVESIERSGLVG